MNKLYSLMWVVFAVISIAFYPQQTLQAEEEFSYYCNSTSDPVDVLPWLSDLIDEVDNNACLQDIAVYCYNGNVYFSPLSDPLVRCSDVLYKTYDVHGDLYCQIGGIAGLNSCPSNFGNATLITTITTGSSGGGGGSSTLTVHCPSNIHVDCNSNTNVCWDLPTASSTCNTCHANEISGYIYMGTFNGSKYYCSDGKATWEQAQAACESIGGYLACVTTPAENHFLANILVNQSAYIGGHDRNRDGHYKWVSGEAFGGYTNWYPGQPNNYNHNQYYVEMLSDGKWNDEYPTRKNEYICEIPCGGNSSPTITGPATCGNFSVGTTPITYTIKDDCGNQKTCTFKVVVESSMSLSCPNDITVQATSHSGKQVSWNDPSINTCCSNSGHGSGGAISGFIYMGKYGSSHYYCSKDNASWSSAKSICISKGGHLAKITSSGENKFLADQLQTQSAWIGLSDKTSEGHFKWTDGSSLGSYQPWYPGQPNNYNGRQHYVELLNNGKWNDQYHYALEYIMEIPAGNSITQTAGPHNGSTVAIGTHTVKYTAQDGCGNTTNCSFDITVLPPVPSGGNYCSAGGHTASQVWIKKVQFANIWSQTGSNGGYKYFNSECGSTSAGDYIDLVLMPGFYHNIYKCYWLVYVDYNNDGDFTDRGEYVAKGSGTSTLKGSIRIPPNINNGKKRVRCVMRVGAWPTGPCGNYDYGETEDYCINVTGGWAQDEDQTETRSREESDPIVLESNEYASAEITVHPNPTNGVINVIQKGEGTIANLEVIDAAGRKVMSVQNPTDRNIRLDLADNTAGLYFVRTVFANGEMTVNKISLVK